mmetsp:Transcript_4195/g.9987  ORF Transcript_4195/g.9987 Transcript_4195/m.9987 type:complete len:216 (+) Transcript_4195:137-784(+)
MQRHWPHRVAPLPQHLPPRLGLRALQGQAAAPRHQDDDARLRVGDAQQQPVARAPEDACRRLAQQVGGLLEQQDHPGHQVQHGLLARLDAPQLRARAPGHAGARHGRRRLLLQHLHVVRLGPEDRPPRHPPRGRPRVALVPRVAPPRGLERGAHVVDGRRGLQPQRRHQRSRRGERRVAARPREVGGPGRPRQEARLRGGAPLCSCLYRLYSALL